MRKVMRKIVKTAYPLINDESGGMLEDLAMWLGGAVIAALVIVVLIALAKGTASTWWADATSWIETQIGF